MGNFIPAKLGKTKPALTLFNSTIQVSGEESIFSSPEAHTVTTKEIKHANKIYKIATILGIGYLIYKFYDIANSL